MKYYFLENKKKKYKMIKFIIYNWEKTNYIIKKNIFKL